MMTCIKEIEKCAVFWNNTLDEQSQLLQDPKLDFNSVVAVVRSLKENIARTRNHFSICELLDAEKSETTDYVSFRKGKR